MTRICHICFAMIPLQGGGKMAFDYKVEYQEYYFPKAQPNIIKIPKMNYIAVRGKGDPNQENGAYKKGIELLYTIAFTIKMSKKAGYQINGYFKYVVPPLEGLWYQEDSNKIDYTRKEDFCFISMIRLPDFVTKKDFDWAIQEATKKKKKDYSQVEFFTYEEELCVQCMHIGPYEKEPTTIQLMEQYASDNNYKIDITKNRHHHEIYLSDPRRCKKENLKTVIRHPIKKQLEETRI